MWSVALRKETVIKDEMHQAADAAYQATNSGALEILARVGFAVSGLLHLLIGVTVLRLASGGGGSADVSGAVAELASQPAGPLLLWSSFAACAALALWQVSDAIFDYGQLPTKDKTLKKLKAAGQAVIYAGLATTLFSFAVGTGSGSDSSSKTSDLTATVLAAPAGVVLLVAVGLGISVGGVIYAVSGIRKSFAKHLVLPSRATPRKAVIALGVTGYVAKGAVLLLTGILVAVAALGSNPEESTGLDGGLKALQDQPYGSYLLAAVGLGLLSYGVFLMVRARLAKM